MKLDPFYPIFESVEQIKRFVPLGIRLVQLRIKDSVIRILRDDIREAKTVCERYNCQLVINDYWQLAIEEGCDCVHLGQEDLSQADLIEIRRNGLNFGLSTHDEWELDIALSTKPDYIALGPIYQTCLKKMKFSPQGLARISLWKKKVGILPLVAIGGFNIERIPMAFAHHCDSVAVVTDILRHDFPAARVKQWIEGTQRWR
ncbi:MAG: thiamine-phosphate pyrophosphorylase [Candidatus Tokpelaia sp. JSC161]|jgi:thiamine-phosphate pyrophosphorylase|nr:MAG: thiamine-phosphate pyrophosphorylase [Candidatus Tokpelaia sp. JSC161]